MVTNTSEESGLEELQRLSREIGDRGRALVQDLGRARKSVEQVERKRALWSIIREFKVSLVLDDLEPLVEYDVFNTVNSLKYERSTADVRRIILKMLDELQESLDVDDMSLIDMPEIKKRLKVLSILLGLIFYIE